MATKRKSPADCAAPSVDRWQTLLVAALVTLVVARTFVPEDPGGRHGHGAPFDVLWLALAGVWLLTALRHNRLRLRFAWPDALVIALVSWYAVSAVVAIATQSPRPAMNTLCDWMSMGLVFLLARQIPDAARDFRAVVVVMLGLAVGMSAVAVHQHFVTIPADVAVYNAAKHSPEALYEQTGQWLPPGSAARVRFEARLDSRLPTAGFALSNSLAGFLVPWLVVLVGISFQLRPPALVAVAGMLAALIVASLWLTGSRTAGVAAVAGLMLLAVAAARARRWPRAWWAAAAAALAVMAVAASILARTGIGKSALDAAWRSVAFRIEYWQATWAMICDHLLVGCGPGQFQDTYTQYKLVGAAEEIQDPHNWLLEVWATAGAPAAVAIVAMIIAVVVRTLRADDRVPDSAVAVASSAAPDAALFGGLAGVVLGTALAWLTGYPLARMHVVLVAAAIVGVWWLLGRWIGDGRLPMRLPLVAALAMLLNLLAAGGIGYPGVADSLWLLLAIQLNGLGAPADGTRSLSATRSVRWSAGLALAGLLAVVIWLEYLPVMGSRLQLEIADAAVAAGQAGLNREALEAALAADPWSATAATRLVTQRFADYRALPTATQIRSLAESDALARQLAPRRASVWAQSADFAAAIYRDTRRVVDREAAERYYARALALYPTNAELHTQSAEFWQSVDEPTRARDAAAEALRLDDAMRAAGHRDRQLNDTLRQEMESLAHGRR